MVCPEVSGVSPDELTSDGRQDRRPHDDRLRRLPHAQQEVQRDPDQYTDATICPLFSEPCDRHLSRGCCDGAGIAQSDRKPIAHVALMPGRCCVVVRSDTASWNDLLSHVGPADGSATDYPWRVAAAQLL